METKKMFALREFMKEGIWSKFFFVKIFKLCIHNLELIVII